MDPETFLQNYEAALATQQWQSVSPLIHKDACVTFSNGTVHRGKSAVQQAFERNFALIQEEKYAISDIHWVQKQSDFAVCIYRFNWQGLMNGKLAAGSGRGTSVMINENKKWLLLAEHLGPNTN